MEKATKKEIITSIITIILGIIIITGNVLSLTANAATSTISITRLYNPATGEHLLASSTAEINTLTAAGWSVDGVMCTMPTTGTPIYRLYNPYSGEHLYTMTQSEINTLKSAGWNVDGVIAYSASAQDGTPIYRLYNPYAEEISSHLLSTSQTEMATLTANGWTIEGIALYAWNGEAETTTPATEATQPATTAPTEAATEATAAPTEAATEAATQPTVAETEPETTAHVHQWNAGEVTTEATCTKTGVMTYTCETCGETKTEEIDKTEHDWVTGYVPEVGHDEYYSVCDCGAYLGSGGGDAVGLAHEAHTAGMDNLTILTYHGGYHETSRWVVDTEGYVYTYCSICGAEQ